MTRENAKHTAFFVDRFSAGLDDLTRKQQACAVTVASTLARLGKFSVFEATENQTIARTMTRIAESGWFKFDHSCGYPWTTVELTDLGRDVLTKAGAA